MFQNRRGGSVKMGIAFGEKPRILDEIRRMIPSH